MSGVGEAHSTMALVKRVEELLESECSTLRPVYGKAYTLGYVLSMLAHACYLSDRVEGYVRDVVADLEARAAARAATAAPTTAGEEVGDAS